MHKPEPVAVYKISLYSPAKCTYQHSEEGHDRKNRRVDRGRGLPRLDAAIRAVVRSGIASGLKVIGIRNGWQGLITNDSVPLSDHAISGIISWGGTILGSSRTDPLKNSDDIKSLKRTIGPQGIDLWLSEAMAHSAPHTKYHPGVSLWWGSPRQ